MKPPTPYPRVRWSPNGGPALELDLGRTAELRSYRRAADLDPSGAISVGGVVSHVCHGRTDYAQLWLNDVDESAHDFDRLVAFKNHAERGRTFEFLENMFRGLLRRTTAAIVKGADGVALDESGFVEGDLVELIDPFDFRRFETVTVTRGANAVPNGGFENGETGWKFTFPTRRDEVELEAADGTHVAVLPASPVLNAAIESEIFFSNPLITDWVLRVKYRSRPGSDPGMSIRWLVLDPQVPLLITSPTPATGNDQWIEARLPFTSNGGNQMEVLGFTEGATGPAEWWVDSFRIVPAIADTVLPFQRGASQGYPIGTLARHVGYFPSAVAEKFDVKERPVPGVGWDCSIALRGGVV